MSDAEIRLSLNESAHIIGRAVTQFATTFDVLQEFFDVITPHAKKIDSKRSKLHDSLVSERVSRVSPEDAETIRDELDRIANTLEQFVESNIGEGDEDATIGLEIETASMHPEVRRLLDDIHPYVVARSRQEILFRSILPMAVGAFEVLIARIVGQCYRVRPGIIGTDGKEFSLDDLRGYSSIEDAFSSAIERRADSLVADGLDEWVRWFGRKGFDIDLRLLAIDWPTTVEIFQRRNIIIHNDGRVSRRYLEKMRPLISDLPALGVELSLDAKYVQRALDSLLVMGHLLAASVGRRLFKPELGRRISFKLVDVIALLVNQGRWEAAKKICTIGKNLTELPSSSRITLQCGEWLSEKHLTGLPGIREQVAMWDTSALGPQYQAIRFALLDQKEATVEAIKSALASGSISRVQVRSLAFFENLRKEEAFTAILDE